MGKIRFAGIRIGESDQGQDDINRSLTGTGQRQIEGRVTNVRDMEPILIITSHAVCGLQSAQILYDGSNDPKPTIVTCPNLYHQERGSAERATMSTQLGPGPLSRLLNHPYSWAIREFGEVAAQSVREIMTRKNCAEGTIVLVGHEVTLPAVLWCLCKTDQRLLIEQVEPREGGLISFEIEV